MKKRLILNADDFGLCESLNLAVEESHQKGVLTSATLMVPAPAFEQAVEIAKRNPKLGIGVHLCLTSEWPSYRWAPSLNPEEVPSLVDQEGFLWMDLSSMFKKAKQKQVYDEWKNQIEICLKHGLSIDHLDNHMGCAMLPPFGKVYRQLAKEYQLPIRHALKLSSDLEKVFQENFLVKWLYKKELRSIRRSGLPILDYLSTPAWSHLEGQGYEDLFQEVKAILTQETPSGSVDFFVHPSLDHLEIREINTEQWQKRIFEFQLLIDPRFKAFLIDEKWERIRYKDL